MHNGGADDIAKLIEPGRVHRRVYTDPDIFELEMERMFGRAWLFVGHTSQVPHAGDFITTELGRQPVIMMPPHAMAPCTCCSTAAPIAAPRWSTSARATRRGSSAATTAGRYDTDGKLVNVPVPEGSGEGFDKADFGLARAPRVGEYRGFVFASSRRRAAELRGPHRSDQSATSTTSSTARPTASSALDAGQHRYVYNGNWKLQVENVLDCYHVPFGHASTVNKQGEQFARREGDQKGAAVVETEQKQTAATWKDRKSYIVGNGHGWTSNTTLDDGKRSSPAYDAYKQALADKVGAERAAQILTPRLHNSLIYPNMSIMGLNIHVRVIKPLAVDRTEVTIYPIRLVGAPDSMNSATSASSTSRTRRRRSCRPTIWNRSCARRRACSSLGTDWVDISRGLGDEEPDRELNATRALATHEMVVRAQYKAWPGYMREAA